MFDLFALLRELLLFTGYVNTQNSFPEPLSSAEEAECIKLLSKGDDGARRMLIEHNLRLVAHISKKYATNARDQDDLISIGTIGLIKAVSSFDSEKGFGLSTYASKCIENEILMSIRSEKKSALTVSLDEPIGQDKDGNEITYADKLGTSEDSVFFDVERHLLSDRVKKIIANTLKGRERMVIELRYGLIGGYPIPQREVAEALNISRSYASRIEKKALAKIKEVIFEEGND
ncbi:MAG: RNA polymerase sporulation sigma factor SigK [Clostridia bacterium]